MSGAPWRCWSLLLLSEIAGPRAWPTLTLALALGLAALLAKAAYAHAADRRIAADRLGLGGAARADFLRRHGGVSPASLAMALLIYPGLFIVGGLLHMVGLQPHPPIDTSIAAPRGMPLLVLTLLAVAPALLLLAYGVLQAHARWRSEALWSVFLIGGVVGLDAAVLETVIGALPALPPLTADAARLALAAGIEEGAKFLVLMLVAERQLGPRGPQDWPLLGLAVGLGFAALENIFAVSGRQRRHGDRPRAHRRAAMPASASWARCWHPGGRRGHRASLMALALAWPMLQHAVYDFAGGVGRLRRRRHGLAAAGLPRLPRPAVAARGRAVQPGADRVRGQLLHQRADRRLPILLGGAMVLAGAALIAIALLWLTGLVPDTTDEPDVVVDLLGAHRRQPVPAGRRHRPAARRHPCAGRKAAMPPPPSDGRRHRGDGVPGAALYAPPAAALWCRRISPGRRQPPRGTAPVAQLDRALPSEGRGHEFESRRVRQLIRRNPPFFR